MEIAFDSAPEKTEKPVKDSLGRTYGTGKRKNSVARVWLKPGSGKITVNDKAMEVYFARPALQLLVGQSLAACKASTSYDVMCTVYGGGLSGQAGAIRHGISKALDAFDSSLHLTLRKGGFLTRDSRVVERKKPGQPKARRKKQFSKR